MSDPAPTSDPRSKTEPHQRFASAIPERIGRYTIVNLLTQGGNGAIYIAQQDEPRREVALKVIRPGVASPRTLRRFKNEAQTLARLGDHPGIAQIFEAQTDGDGDNAIPYFAMEYIRGGLPITTAAIERKLSLRDRVALFQLVCDAVAHGHSKGVLHRDLKPSNILLDLSGRPKVIDFGIARAIDADMVTPSLQTQQGQLIGTPWYMSPEQTRGESDTLTPASDIYALGVILYELCCEALPYEVSGKPITEVIEIIRHQEPRPPNRTNPDFPAPLQWIIRKAMHKDAHRRYRDAHAMSADLAGFLNNQPISAGPERFIAAARDRSIRAASRRPALIAALILCAAIGVGWIATTATSPPAAVMVQRWRERLFPADPTVRRFDDVRIIALTDKTDWTALAKSESQKDFDPTDRKQRRLLHARLLDRLARSGARAVVFDLYFLSTSDFDSILAKGADLGLNTTFVFATQDWSFSAAPDPLLKAARFGGATMNSNKGDLDVELAVFPPSGGSGRFSLALEAFAAWSSPRGTPRVTVDSDGALILRPDVLTASPVLVQTSGILVEDRADAKYITLGESVAYFPALIPSSDVVAAATLEFQDVFAADSVTLRKWFQDRIVVVGDHNDPQDIHQYSDGRLVPGSVAHATAIQALINCFGFRAGLAPALALCAAGSVLAIAASLARRPVLVIGLSLATAAALFITPVLTLHTFALMSDPIAALASMLVALAMSKWFSLRWGATT